jgi:ribosome maturation factor RimP
MQNHPPEGPVVDAIREIINPRGYALVAFSAETVRRRMHVHCVLHHHDGVGLDSLAEIHRALEPRLEVLFDTRDLRVEFSSPGVGRTFGSFHEFQVFLGEEVAVLPVDSPDWITGTVIAADGSVCTIRCADTVEHSFTPESVAKARRIE